MQRVGKLCCNGFSILTILISILNSNNVEEINKDNVKEYVASDCISVSNFIEDNLSTFVFKYNETTTDKWNASYIEDKKIVIDTISNEQYYYLDFDEDNGYAVVGNDYDFVDFSITGDLEYTKDKDLLYWNEYDKFVYEDNGQYIRYDIEYLIEDDLKEYSFGYDGKYKEEFSGGSDVITDIPAYIKSRYGDGWYCYEDRYLNNYQDVYQSDYAVINGEGNCTLSAYLGIFQYLRDNKRFSNLPRYNTTITYNNLSIPVPAIYAKIREKAMRYGYTTESNFSTSYCMASWGNEALYSMGCRTPYNSQVSYIHRYLFWSFSGQVVNNINDGYPVMWNQARGNYSNHSMVVKGYKTYKKDNSWWFIKWSSYKHFMTMNNNWWRNTPVTYIDFDGYSSDYIHEGFGTFVVVKDYIWKKL